VLRRSRTFGGGCFNNPTRLPSDQRLAGHPSTFGGRRPRAVIVETMIVLTTRWKGWSRMAEEFADPPVWNLA
jgi:hypothetical protein